MYVILMLAIVFAVMYVIAAKKFVIVGESESRIHFGGIVAVCAVAILVRFVCAKCYYGHETDMGCFFGWSSLVYEKGFSGFYTSESFTDYPPGYMYVLYVIGFIKSFIGDSVVLMKLPAMLFDMFIGVAVYIISLKKRSQSESLALSGFFMLCPAVIINSALWGQVDSVYTFFVVLFVALLYRKRLILSYFMFAAALFIKPQALIYTPVLLIALWENVLKGFDKKHFLKHMLCGVSAIGLIFVLSIPFGIGEVLKQYVFTLSSYPYATVNAFNLYGLLGLNWSQLTPFMNISGYVFIVCIVAFVFFCYAKGCKNLYFLAGVLAFSTYMLSVKMHERYAYPAIVFFLLAYAVGRNKYTFFMFVLTVFSQFINTAWVLFVYNKDINKYAFSPDVRTFSGVNLCIFAYMVYACFKEMTEPTDFVAEKVGGSLPTFIMKSRTLGKMTRTDVVMLLVLCTVYSAVAFYNLGDMKAPQTWYDLATAPISIDLDKPENIEKLVIYPSCNDVYEDRSIKVTYTLTDGTKEEKNLDSLSVFTWSYTDVFKEVTNITLSTDSDRLMLMEVGLICNGEVMDIESENPVFDEQHLVPKRNSYKNGAYFDEIYHARTAYEFIHGFNVYEWTHPPFGKFLMSLGIRIFGMNPFGWRFMGTLFGVLMLPVFYILAKRMFKITHIAFLSTLIFAFDFMHFAQTRIATIDVYGTFFIMLMYMFMYKYYNTSFYDTPLKKTFVPLLLTGAAFGLGAASKWTAVYACAGIAVIFFGIMLVRYNEYYSSRSRLPHNAEFTSSFVKTGFLCVLAFIVIPVIIYMLSYIPYLSTENTNGLKTIIDNQRDMYVYHSKTVLGSEHPYASKWYTWPMIIRPMFYYSGTPAENVYEGISAFGNPAVWWIGIAAVIANVVFAIMKNDRKSIYLLVGYFSCLLPWVPIARTTYIYHYFPCVPFMALMTGHCFEKLYYKSVKLERRIFIGYATVAVLLFIMFYPVLSGKGISAEYTALLRWMDSWVLNMS